MWFHKSTIRCKTVHTTSSPSPASSQSWSILRQENWSGRERRAWKGWKLGGQTILVPKHHVGKSSCHCPMACTAQKKDSP
ncbi:hypothetical protein C1H46_027447 [Malus baccata]|uniref:Uncharacterized protein n=1 Tax=Malus baccata TaxID=106549 RepID=A0A540LKZ0_MALBA|nr:hypothetical protein C1H46_027447 [Malus baccata]